MCPDSSQKLGLHTDANGKLSWFGNQAAFTQPCVLGGTTTPTVTTFPTASPTDCVPLNGTDALGGGPSTTRGPGFHRLDFSAFKDFPLTERFLLQFRAEFFNIFNHPNFNAPGFGGNGVVCRPRTQPTSCRIRRRRPSAKLVQRAMLHTIRARSSSR